MIFGFWNEHPCSQAILYLSSLATNFVMIYVKFEADLLSDIVLK
jgi:hypothetical protein